MMTSINQAQVVSKDFMKEWGLRFLKSLNADKEDYLNQFKMHYARLINEALQDRGKLSYSIDDVQEIFKNMQDMIERQLGAAMVNLSLKGLQHLRAILEYGENALDFLPMATLEEMEKEKGKLKAREEARKMDETRSPASRELASPSPIVTPPPEWLQSVEEKMKHLEERMARAFGELEQRIQDVGRQSQVTSKDSLTLEHLLNEVQHLSMKLDQEQERLAIEIKHLQGSMPRDEETRHLEDAIKIINQQYEEIKNHLLDLQAKVEEKLTLAERVPLPTIEGERKPLLTETTILSTTPPSSPDAPKMRDTSQQVPAQQASLDATSISEFRKILESTLVDMKSTLMDPLRARHQLDQLERKLEDAAPPPGIPHASSPEYEELKKTIESFKRKLRERDLILEHTRKALSSNPKYAALWILQELGELPLSTLGKSVGVPPVVLKKLLLDFEEQGLIRFIGDDLDPVVQVVLDVPT